MTGMTRARIALVMVAASALVLAATAAARTHAGAPITIGWAFDSKGAMAPFDGPALAAAELRVKQINAKGGVGGRPLQIKTCDTQGNKPAIAKACALKLLGQGANDHVHDVRRRLRRAGRAGDDQPRRPRGRSVHRHRSDGAEALRREGQARLQLRQRRAGRGLGDGRLRVEEGLAQRRRSRPTPSSSTSRTSPQRSRRAGKQLGGKIVDQETYQDRRSAGTTSRTSVSRLSNVNADVIVTSTAGAFGALSTIITGLRTLGNNTPILNSWAGDGTYWLPKDPKVTNYWFVTFASAFGNDPNPAINKLAKQVKAGTGGFVTGSAAIDGVATAIKRAGGSTNGAALAAQMVKFKKVPTLSGLVSFSPKLHTVFGRQYRVITIQNNIPRVVGTIVAKVVPHI